MCNSTSTLSRTLTDAQQEFEIMWLLANTKVLKLLKDYQQEKIFNEH